MHSQMLKLMHTLRTLSLFITSLLFVTLVNAATPTLEIMSNSYTGTPYVGGTVSAQRNTYVFNANNPTDNTGSLNYFPKINVD